MMLAIVYISCCDNMYNCLLVHVLQHIVCDSQHIGLVAKACLIATHTRARSSMMLQMVVLAELAERHGSALQTCMLWVYVVSV